MKDLEAHFYIPCSDIYLLSAQISLREAQVDERFEVHQIEVVILG